MEKQEQVFLEKNPKASEILKNIYKGLRKEITPEAIQTKEFGQVTNGYKIGYLIDRMNEVMNENNCYWDFVVLPIRQEGEDTLFLRDIQGDARETVSVKVRVSIYDDMGRLLIKRESFGGIPMVNKNFSDTLKGAQTDALKKVFSYFGLGNDAFCGLIDNQIAVYGYLRREKMTRIEELLVETVDNLTQEKLSEEVVKRACCMIAKKNYEKIGSIMLNDMDIIIKDLEKRKKSGENSSGKNKAKTSKESVGKPKQDNDDIPF